MNCQRRSPLHDHARLCISDRSTGATTYHGQRVGVGGSQGIPLHGDLTGWAGIGTVVARLATLVGAHGPTGVLLVRSDGNQTGIGREFTLRPLHEFGDGRLTGFVAASMVVAVTGVDAGNERDERCGGEELHGAE